MSGRSAKRAARTAERLREILSTDPPPMTRRQRGRLRKRGNVGALGTGKTPAVRP